MLNVLEYKFHICVKYEYTIKHSICNGVEVDIAVWVDAWNTSRRTPFSFNFVDKELMTIQSETNESKSNESKSNEQSKELHVAIKVSLIN